MTDQQTDPVPPLEEQEDEFTAQLEQAEPAERDRGPVDDECICGADGGTGARMDVVCPKHDGEVPG